MTAGPHCRKQVVQWGLNTVPCDDRGPISEAHTHMTCPKDTRTLKTEPKIPKVGYSYPRTPNSSLFFSTAAS